MRNSLFCCGCIEEWWRNVVGSTDWPTPASIGFNMFAGERCAGILCTRISYLFDVPVTSKTMDNVFVKMSLCITYRVVKENAADAFYGLTYPFNSIKYHMFHVLQAHVSKMTFDQLFEQYKDLAKAASEELNKRAEAARAPADARGTTGRPAAARARRTARAEGGAPDLARASAAAAMGTATTVVVGSAQQHGEGAASAARAPSKREAAHGATPTRLGSDRQDPRGAIALWTATWIHVAISGYGLNIEDFLIVDINPLRDSVYKAMNDLNAVRMMELASAYKGEAEKVVLVKKAEAEAEAKYLCGVGMARQRQAIADGLRENMLNFPHDHNKVLDVFMNTTNMDVVKDLLENSSSSSANNTTVLVPPRMGN
ncbi:hypothetical protein Scep_006095 [Stephania cephalantha]|uniref:Band 7 domain-containing protein n=1 Tax=Stephania cephalantha TaxID=152367 RepID=A0AAP0PJS0_9MAGN